MDEGIVKIILAVMALLNAIITGVVVPYIKSRTTAEQRDNVYALISIAVGAAEQVLKMEDPTGLKRKHYVITYLEGKGIKINDDDLDVFIEAAVQELNMIKKEALE